MRKDHRPLYIKRAYLKFQKFYAKRFLRPQFESLGRGFDIMKPWHVEVFGEPVRIGNFATIIAAPDKRVRFSIWSEKKDIDGINIGDYCLISPGVRISAASSITIGDSCMLASGVYITDSDWHGIYDRSRTSNKVRAVVLEDNVWLGDGVVVCKGVTIGENSIIGAGSVVTRDVPPNVIAAGNPVRIVSELDQEKKITPRSHLYENPEILGGYFKEIDRQMLGGNSVLKWIKSLWAPTVKD